jgi:hypothetical protein
MASVPARWLERNVPHVCERGRERGLRRGMYRATVSLLTTCPSLASSHAVRRRLHVGFSRASRTMSSTMAGAIGRRPAQRERRAQKRTKPRRCQPITVSGFTTTRVSAHRDHARESTTQNARSTGRNLGRGAARRRTASCCRRARFSAMRLARGRKPAMSAAVIEESRAITAAPLPSSASASCHRHGSAHGEERRGAGRPRYLATLFRRARLWV